MSRKRHDCGPPLISNVRLQCGNLCLRRTTGTSAVPVAQLCKLVSLRAPRSHESPHRRRKGICRARFIAREPHPNDLWVYCGRESRRTTFRWRVSIFKSGLASNFSLSTPVKLLSIGVPGALASYVRLRQNNVCGAVMIGMQPNSTPHRTRVEQCTSARYGQSRAGERER